MAQLTTFPFDIFGELSDDQAWGNLTSFLRGGSGVVTEEKPGLCPSFPVSYDLFSERQKERYWKCYMETCMCAFFAFPCSVQHLKNTLSSQPMHENMYTDVCYHEKPQAPGKPKFKHICYSVKNCNLHFWQSMLAGIPLIPVLQKEFVYVATSFPTSVPVKRKSPQLSSIPISNKTLPVFFLLCSYACTPYLHTQFFGYLYFQIIKFIGQGLSHFCVCTRASIMWPQSELCHLLHDCLLIGVPSPGFSSVPPHPTKFVMEYGLSIQFHNF